MAQATEAEISADEIDDFLGHNETGVLSAVLDGELYSIPVSYGYDESEKGNESDERGDRVTYRSSEFREHHDSPPPAGDTSVCVRAHSDASVCVWAHDGSTFVGRGCVGYERECVRCRRGCVGNGHRWR